MTEDEYREFLARRRMGLPCVAAKASGVSVADMDKPKKKNKYNARKVTIDGMKFDSQHEADVYFGQLMPRVKNGELRCVLRQVPFDLPGGVRYLADFVTVRPDMSIEGVYDAKSEATSKDKVFVIKRKQVKAIYGIHIVEL